MGSATSELDRKINTRALTEFLFCFSVANEKIHMHHDFNAEEEISRGEKGEKFQIKQAIGPEEQKRMAGRRSMGNGDEMGRGGDTHRLPALPESGAVPRASSSRHRPNYSRHNPLGTAGPAKNPMPRAKCIPLGARVPRAEIALGKDF
jgi:hypothetical protein